MSKCSCKEMMKTLKWLSLATDQLLTICACLVMLEHADIVTGCSEANGNYATLAHVESRDGDISCLLYTSDAADE